MIKILVEAVFENGQYEFKWNTAEISAGIYFLQFDVWVKLENMVGNLNQ